MDTQAVSPSVVDANRLRVAVFRMTRAMRSHPDEGLTPTQVSALSSISQLGPIRLGDLAGHEGVTPPTLSRSVGMLETAGLVTRHADPDDARSARVECTAEGSRLLERLRTESTHVLTRRLEQLDDGDRAALHAVLPALEVLAGIEPGR